MYLLGSSCVLDMSRENVQVPNANVDQAGVEDDPEQRELPATIEMQRSSLTVNKALVLATGAAVISVACVAVLAKSVCSWLWSGNDKEGADSSKGTAVKASPRTSQVSDWVQQGLLLAIKF